MYPQSTTLQLHFCILNLPFSIIQPQFFFIHPQLSIFNFFSSILVQNYVIFDQKCPQNSGILTKCPQALLAPLAAFSRSAKKFGSKKISGPRTILGQKKFWFKKDFDQSLFSIKNLFDQKILEPVKLYRLG